MVEKSIDSTVYGTSNDINPFEPTVAFKLIKYDQNLDFKVRSDNGKYLL